MYVYSDVVKTT